MTEPTVLFEDNHCLALAKPGGLPTQGVPDGRPTLESWAKQYLKAKHRKSGRVYLGVPHRLDRPVSGVVVFARSTKSARRLAEQFRERTTEKVYWAAVEGRPPAEGVWDDWLRKRPDEARAEIVDASTPTAKLATTAFRRLADWSGGAILELRPTTGRMHQLRIQAAHRGHPILGDAWYGSTGQFGPASDTERDRIIALHARQLTFLHPIRYEPVTVTAAAPRAWELLHSSSEFAQLNTMLENPGGWP